MSTGVPTSPTLDYSTQGSQEYIPDCLENLIIKVEKTKYRIKEYPSPQSADGKGKRSNYVIPVTTCRLWQSQNLQPQLLGLTPGVWKVSDFQFWELSLCWAVLSQAQLYQWGRAASSAPAQPLFSSWAKSWFVMADPTHSKKKLISVPQKLFFYLFIFRNMFPANLVEATFKQVSGYIPFADERHKPALYETCTFVKHNPDTDMAYDCWHC